MMAASSVKIERFEIYFQMKWLESVVCYLWNGYLAAIPRASKITILGGVHKTSKNCKRSIYKCLHSAQYTQWQKNATNDSKTSCIKKKKSTEKVMTRLVLDKINKQGIS